jgi:hypothetical protein
MRRRFKPFERDGTPVRATFTDYVAIVPPEEWASPRVPFPAIQDWSTLRIRLQRTACYGTCPGYSVELRGDGEVLFEGEGNVLIVGRHRGRISKEALAGLVADFRDANYFSVKDEYVSMTTDLPPSRHLSSLTGAGEPSKTTTGIGQAYRRRLRGLRARSTRRRTPINGFVARLRRDRPW